MRLGHWFLFVVCLVGLPRTVFSQKKLALIVAIGNYPFNSGCPPIASLNDLPYVKGALKAQGFLEKNIDTLKDSKATKSGILKALDVLIAKAKKNDIVVLHFACHGQQIRDQATVDAGKDEDDGYDEAIVPYDAKARYNPGPGGYKGENHLRDDELGKKFMAIRNAIGTGGSLLVLLDACHSGSASRSDEFMISRGEPVPFPDPEQPADSIVQLSANTENSFMGSIADTASNMVFISASGPNQQNFQTIDPAFSINSPKRNVGSLSYAFAKAMLDLPAESDYQLLFDKIKARIQSDHPTQLPMIEGKTNQKIFSGAYTQKEDRIILKQGIRELGFAGDTIFSVQRGLLQNIAAGTACKIYVLGKKELYTTGIIRKAGNFYSIGVAEKPLKKAEAYEVKIEELNYGDFAAAILIKAGDSKDAAANLLEKQVKELVKKYKYLSLSNNNADMMIDIAATNPESITLSLSDAGTTEKWIKQLKKGDVLAADDEQALMSGIKDIIRVRYLRSLTDGGELVKNISAKIFSRDNPSTGSAEAVLSAKEKYTIRLDYQLAYTVYYTVINILPDNTVKVLIPDGNSDAREYSLSGTGPKEIRLKVDAAGIPGREVFKIIFSKEPLDIKSVFERKATRSSMASFEAVIDDLFKDGNNAAATRADISAVNAEEIGILTVGFTIKKQ